jgi:hypothetical protein
MATICQPQPFVNFDRTDAIENGANAHSDLGRPVVKSDSSRQDGWITAIEVVVSYHR